MSSQLCKSRCNLDDFEKPHESPFDRYKITIFKHLLTGETKTLLISWTGVEEREHEKMKLESPHRCHHDIKSMCQTPDRYIEI
jgi:hypothetical protein